MEEMEVFVLENVFGSANCRKKKRASGHPKIKRACEVSNHVSPVILLFISLQQPRKAVGIKTLNRKFQSDSLQYYTDFFDMSLCLVDTYLVNELVSSCVA